jgi:SAM-dependent methyltransferase
MYSLISTKVRNGENVTFLNYGYATLTGEDPDVTVRPEDREEFYGIQLYYRVAGARDLSDKDVLEVGCGRGGGSSFIARYLNPRTVTGVDLAAPAVKFCRRRHGLKGLNFCEGDAEHLPFAPASFDAVINVESSHCYPSFGRFLAEVSRVLRPGGVFLLADLRAREEFVRMREELERVFTIVEERCITPEVFRALELFSERREAWIRKEIPVPFQRAARNLAAVEGTPAFDSFVRGELAYFRFVLAKRDYVDAASV